MPEKAVGGDRRLSARCDAGRGRSRLAEIFACCRFIRVHKVLDQAGGRHDDVTFVSA